MACGGVGGFVERVEKGHDVDLGRGPRGIEQCRFNVLGRHEFEQFLAVAGVTPPDFRGRAGYLHPISSACGRGLYRWLQVVGVGRAE